MKWLLGSAKTVGKSHISSGTVCQDSVGYELIENNNSFVLALSDGAGSAIQSDIGSQMFTKMVCKAILQTYKQVSTVSNKNLDDLVRKTIFEVRNELVKLGDLKEFNATALIAIGNEKEVRVYHIGDGSALIAERLSKSKFSLHRSEPENGEFSNETYFFTLDDWETRLRIKSIKNPAFCILCSDGIDPFVWDPNKGTRLGFIKPLIKKVYDAGSTQKVNDELTKIIEDPRTNDVTTDDKSLVVAISPEININKLEGIIFEDQIKPIYKDPEELNKQLSEALKTKNKDILKSQEIKTQTYTKLTPTSNSNVVENNSNPALFFLGFLLALMLGVVAAAFFIWNNPKIIDLKINFIETIQSMVGVKNNLKVKSKAPNEVNELNKTEKMEHPLVVEPDKKLPQLDTVPPTKIEPVRPKKNTHKENTKQPILIEPKKDIEPKAESLTTNEVVPKKDTLDSLPPKLKENSND